MLRCLKGDAYKDAPKILTNQIPSAKGIRSYAVIKESPCRTSHRRENRSWVSWIPPPITTAGEKSNWCTVQERGDNGDEAGDHSAACNLESWNTIDGNLAWLGGGNGSDVGGSFGRCNNLNLSIRDLGDRNCGRGFNDWLGGGSLNLSVGDLGDWGTSNASGRLHA